VPLFFPGLVDPEDLLALVLHALGHVLGSRLMIKDDLQHLAEVHLLDRQLGTHKGVRTNLAFEVYGFIYFDFVCHVPPISDLRLRIAE
jgi:hypothetical protein